MAELNGGVIRQAVELASFYETELKEPLTCSFQPTFNRHKTMTTTKNLSTRPQNNPSPCTSYRTRLSNSPSGNFSPREGNPFSRCNNAV